MSSTRPAFRQLERILITASTFPASKTDPVPAFVKEQAVNLHRQHPELDIHVLAPNDAYSKKPAVTAQEHYTEHRFHYLWPFRFELVAGRGIAPAIKRNKWLALEIPFLVLFEFFATWHLIRKLRPDLVYAHWFTPQGITAALAAKLTGTPFMFTTHASDVVILKNLPFAKRLVAAVCRQAFAFTAVSQQTADKLRSLIPEAERMAVEAKLHIIPMGTHLQPAPTKDEVTQIKAAYHMSDSRVVLSMGRLVRRKGIDDLLQAFQKAASKEPKARLIIAGDGQQRTELEQLTKKLQLDKQVTFAGYVSGKRKQELLNMADILCIPSINEGDHSEGLPVTFMEGVAAGKTIIASDVSGCQEYINPGVNGFIFAQKNIAQLAVLLESALAMTTEDQQHLSQAARELAVEFDWPRIVNLHYDLFKLGGHPEQTPSSTAADTSQAG